MTDAASLIENEKSQFLILGIVVNIFEIPSDLRQPKDSSFFSGYESGKEASP